MIEHAPHEDERSFDQWCEDTIRMFEELARHCEARGEIVGARMKKRAKAYRRLAQTVRAEK